MNLLSLLYFILIPHIFSDNSNNTSNIQLENYQPLPSDNNDSLRSFYRSSPPVGDIDTDDTSDDEFILYVDDDKNIYKNHNCDIEQFNRTNLYEVLMFI